MIIVTGYTLLSKKKITTGYDTKWYKVEYVNGSNLAILYACNSEGFINKEIGTLKYMTTSGDIDYFVRADEEKEGI